MTLRAVARAPARLWLIPFLLAVILLSARVAISAPLQEERRRADILALLEQQRKQLPKEMQENPPDWLKPPPPRAASVIYGPPLVSGIGLLFLGFIARAGVLHLLCLALGGQNRFGQVLSVASWAAIPFAVRDGVQAAAMHLSRQLIVHQGLSGLVAGGGLLSALAAQVDLYLFWHLLLLILGVSAMARFGRAKALLIATGYWLLAIAVGLLPALLTRFFQGGQAPGGPGPVFLG
jgi:hypothetical protein